MDENSSFKDHLASLNLEKTKVENELEISFEIIAENFEMSPKQMRETIAGNTLQSYLLKDSQDNLKVAQDNLKAAQEKILILESTIGSSGFRLINNFTS